MKSAYLLAVLIFGIVKASGIDKEEHPEDTLKRGLTNKCVQRETSSCIAIELVGYVDRMLRTASFQLGEDVMIVDESQGAASEIPVKKETLARAGTSLEDQAQQLIMDKLWHFVSSRSLRYRLLNDADLVISGKQEKDGSLGVGVSMKPPKVYESGRGRQKPFGPVLALAALKFGLFGALTFKVLALMVGKALLISKIALLLSTIIGLKKLFSSQAALKLASQCARHETVLFARDFLLRSQFTLPRTIPARGAAAGAVAATTTLDAPLNA